MILWLALGMNVAATAQETFTEGDFNYSVLADGTLAVTQCTLSGGMAIVPQSVTHEGTTYTVTAIGAGAFSGTAYAAIGLPQTITTIGDGAFSYCSSTTYIQIPASVTTIGKDAFRGCTALGHLSLPSDLKRLEDGVIASCTGVYDAGVTKFPALKYIGNEALYGCNSLPELDLSDYMGPVGLRAFNGCYRFQNLNLPANNPYVQLSGGGKALVGANKGEAPLYGEVLTVLPSLRELVISYPATGIHNTLDGAYFKKLEVPYTWLPTSYCYVESDNGGAELTIRAPYVELPQLSEGTKVRVFDYALGNYQRYQQQHPLVEFQSIDYPTMQLYIQEVLPMYPGSIEYRQGDKGVKVAVDVNQLLEERLPDYFTNAGTAKDMTDYRMYFINKYMDDEHQAIYSKRATQVIHCLDGDLRLAEDFDVNDYFNWYTHTGRMYADQLYQPAENVNSIEVTTDPSWNVPNNTCWLVENSTGIGSFSVNYPLNLLPGVEYDVYLLLPPRHPQATEELPCNNKLRLQLAYNDGTATTKGEVRIKNSTRVDLDVQYDGTPKEYLLWENFTVGGDYGNMVVITSRITTADRGKGYADAFPIIGFELVAKTELPNLPTVIREHAEQQQVVERYDLSGRRISGKVPGVNLLRMNDGSTRKVVVRP